VTQVVSKLRYDEVVGCLLKMAGGSRKLLTRDAAMGGSLVGMAMFYSQGIARSMETTDKVWPVSIDCSAFLPFPFLKRYRLRFQDNK